MGKGVSLLERYRRNTASRTPKQGPGIDYAEVARVAYELYEQRGRLPGNDLDDWLRAEAIVKQRRRS